VAAQKKGRHRVRPLQRKQSLRFAATEKERVFILSTDRLTKGEIENGKEIF